MKLIRLSYAVFALLIMGCTIDGNQFIGKWHRLSSSPVSSTFILTIKKAGDYYVMLSSEKTDEPIVLKYDSKTKLMSGGLDGMHFTISYSSITDYILFSPEQGDNVLFKRIK